jgi:ABC-2 type transport system ATP-binding protein
MCQGSLDTIEDGGDSSFVTLLVVRDVVKEYKRGARANDGVSIDLAAGEVLGMLGPNGAGKTTLVRQVLGLVKPTSGTITIDGVDVVADPSAARDACSYQPQSQVPLYMIKPRRAIELLGRMRGLEHGQARSRAGALLERLELGEWADKRTQETSGGVMRLVAVCMAVVAPGRIVILDEPTNDVDPLRRKILWEMVRDVAAAGSSVLLVTHNVAEADRAVDRLVIMDGGRVVAQGRPSELRQAREVPLRLEAVAIGIEPPAFLVHGTRVGPRVVGGLRESDVEVALRWCREQQAAGVVEEYAIGPATLEDVYVEAMSR